MPHPGNFGPPGLMVYGNNNVQRKHLIDEQMTWHALQ